MSEIQAILLDADGVVQHPAANWRAAIASLCADPERTDEFIEDVFAVEAPSLIGLSDFAADLKQVLVKWQSPASIDEALRIWTLISPDPAVLQLVSDLRSADLLVCLASNQQRRRADFMARQLNYANLFDHLFFSCNIGYRKPGEDYFLAILSDLSLDGSQVLFVDDHQANVHSARCAGLNAEVFHPGMDAVELQRMLAQYGVQ